MHGIVKFFLALAAGLASSPTIAGGPAAPAIAAAADLKFALDEIAVAFRDDTGKVVRISFGSSGKFQDPDLARRAVRTVPVSRRSLCRRTAPCWPRRVTRVPCMRSAASSSLRPKGRRWGLTRNSKGSAR